MIRYFRSKLSMTRGMCLFVDKVSGKEVFLYKDCFGEEWMAEWNCWFFRVKK